MATKKTQPETVLTARQLIAKDIAAAFYSGPAGHHLMDNEDGDQMQIVVDKALEFADIFLKQSA